MKKPFLHIINLNSRKLVAHQINLPLTLVEKLQCHDVLFLDDCLYSQYLFLKECNALLQLLDIACVLGFSTQIYRKDGMPILYAACAECHDKIHEGDMTALQAYMSINEIKEMLAYDNIYLACHGAMHILLSKTTNTYTRAKLFKNDLIQAVADLNQYGMSTSIFVFPYAYSNILCAYKELNANKFYYVFAGKDSMRTQIEDMKDE